MRILGIAAVLMVIAGPAYALPDNPEFKQWRKNVPAGWKAIGLAQGKLNANSAGDAVLIIEQDSPALRIKNDGLGEPSLNLNPRRLIFLNKAQSGYRQVSIAEGFMPTEGSKTSPCLSDPLEAGGIDITKGVFSVKLQYWLSCGSYDVTTRTFKFRPENGKHRLIGIEVESFSRTGSGGGTQVSVNYLTGKKKTTTGVTGIGPDIEDEKPPVPKTSWSKLVPTKFYLENMKQSDCYEYDDAPSWCYS